MNDRIKALDGMRGLMAVNVVLCHFVCVFYPHLYQTTWAIQYGGSTAISSGPLNVLINGDVAVRYFFVLSGFLSAMSVLKKEKFNLAQSMLNRYLRFLPIVFVATLFTVVLMATNTLFHESVSLIANNPDFLADYYTFDLNIGVVINNLFVKTFTRGNDFVRPFWTLKYEFWGSLIVMATTYLFLHKKWRRIGYVGMAVLVCYILDGNYFGFFAGALLADLFYNANESTYISGCYSRIINHKVVLSICFLVGTILACVPMEFGQFYSFMNYFPIGSALYRTVGISLIMWCILNTQKIQRILENRVLLFVGKLSFSIYAFHWPILCSVQMGLFLLFYEVIGYDFSAIASFVLASVVIFCVSCMSNKYIDVQRWRLRLPD